LQEVSTQINTNREKKIEKNLHFRVPGHRALAKVHFEIFDIYIIFEHVFINNKLHFRVLYLTGTSSRNIFFVIFI